MARPKTIVTKSDEQKKFSGEVFDLIRTKLAPVVGGNVNFAVKLAADSFTPRKPGEVTAVEMGDAIPQIIAKFAADAKQPVNSNDDRLPLNDEAQKLWDSGTWKGKLTIHGLRDRFKAEIKDGVDLTKSMVEAYVAELAAERAKVVELLDEQPDPDKKELVACVFVAHRGDEDDDRQFQPTISYKLFRNSDGKLERQKHSQGNEYIRVGHFLVLKDEKTGEVTGETEAYCSSCRDAARELARNVVDKDGNPTPVKLTFYTWAGAHRVVSAAKQRAEIDVAATKQIQSAGARTFGGGYGTRKVKGDWRATRGASRR